MPKYPKHEISGTIEALITLIAIVESGRLEYLEEIKPEYMMATGHKPAMSYEEFLAASEDELVELVEDNVINFTDVPVSRQTKRLCEVALQNSPSGWIFHFIHNPTKEMRHEALRVDCRLLKYMANQTEEEQKIAVTQCPLNILYATNSSVELIKQVIDSDNNYARYLNTPKFYPDEVCLYILGKEDAVTQSWGIRTDNPEILKKILSINPSYLWKIDNQTEEMAMIAARQDGNLLRHVRVFNQTDEVVSAAIAQSPSAVQFIIDTAQKERFYKPLVPRLEDSDKDCCVCMEACETMTFVCHHTLCHQCYPQIQANTCPLCRRNI